MTVCACGAPPPAPREAEPGERTTLTPDTRFDHARVADDAVRKLRGYGIPLDFSPASLLALDAFLDSTIGDEGYAPNEEEWAPDPSQRTLILLYGSYLGEVVRRRLGGSWQDAADGEELGIQVVLPSGERFFPFARLWKRLRSGVGHALSKAFDDLVAPLPAGHAAPSEAPQWVAMGDVFLAAGQPRVAERFYERARSIDPRLHKAAEASERVRRSTMPPPPDRPASETETVRPSQTSLVALSAASSPEEPAPPSSSSRNARTVPPMTRPVGSWPPPRPSTVPPPARPPTTPPAARVPTIPSPERPATSRPPPRPATVPPPARPPSAPPIARPPSAPPLAASAPQRSSRPPPPAADDAEAHGAPSSRVLAARAGVAIPELASDLCALALAGDAEAIDEVLASNEDQIGPGLVHELGCWGDQAARESDAKAHEETSDALTLLAVRIAGRGHQSHATTLLQRSARALGPVLSLAKRAELLRRVALAQAAGDAPRRNEDALAVLDAATRLLDPKLHADAWASLHRAIAEIQLKRQGNARKDAVDAAIHALHQALRTRTKKDDPAAWASLQLELGLAIRHRISGDRQQNVDDAMSAFRSAIDAAEINGDVWGRAEQGLGICLMTSMKGDRSKLGEEAIAALEASIAALPVGSAAASRSHYHLGLAYQRRKIGTRAANLEKATSHYRESAAGLDADGTGEHQSLAENLEAAEREIRKLKTAGT